jgi:hypothetical protein
MNEQAKRPRRSRANIAAHYVGGGSLILTFLTWIVFMVAQFSSIDFLTDMLLLYTWYLQIAALVVGVGLALITSLCWRRFCWSPLATCVYFVAVLGACSQYAALNRMPVASWTIP